MRAVSVCVDWFFVMTSWLMNDIGLHQMLDDPHFTPPESPLMTAMTSTAAAYDDGGKFSNVSWCAHYLQVLGSEKQHSFKVRT